jgi:hypothetical protein
MRKRNFDSRRRKSKFFNILLEDKEKKLKVNMDCIWCIIGCRGYMQTSLQLYKKGKVTDKRFCDGNENSGYIRGRIDVVI